METCIQVKVQFKNKQNVNQCKQNIFRIKSAFDFNQLLAEVFKSPMSEKFARLIGNEIFQTFLKDFWNLWKLHLENINELTYDEDKIIKLWNENKKLLDSFKAFDGDNDNSNNDKKRKLPFSLLTLRHIYLAFLCHLILQHLQWESFGNKDKKKKNNNNNHNENNKDNDDDIEMMDDDNEEEKAMMIDDDKLYGNTPQNDDDDDNMKNDEELKQDGLYDFSSITNDVIATRITRCMRVHRPFDINYKIILPNGKDVKYTKIRYISMEHCALIVVNDEEIQKCNLPSPKVRLTLNTYINESGDIKNLSGRHSLIKLLCENIVRRAKDPLSTTSTTLGLMNTTIFSTNILIILFGFLNWRDLLNFGYCSQLAYNISNNPELWKLMYKKQYQYVEDDKSISNWKNKFLTSYVQQKQLKSGQDEATQDLIRQLLRQQQ